jgi:hypothetical protein
MRFSGVPSKCKVSAFGDEPRRMLKVIQRFDKHYGCHLQGEYTGWAFFGSFRVGQAVSGGWCMTDLICGAAERPAAQFAMNM